MNIMPETISLESRRSFSDTDSSKEEVFVPDQWSPREPIPHGGSYSLNALQEVYLRHNRKESPKPLKLEFVGNTLNRGLDTSFQTDPRYHYIVTFREDSNVDRTSLKHEIRSLLTTSENEKRDGKNVRAISAETVGIAERIVDLFPSDVDNPTLTATPHGEVDFDWVIDRDVMLTISIGPAGDIAFAALIKTLHLNATEPWEGVLPNLVIGAFEHLKKAQNL